VKRSLTIVAAALLLAGCQTGPGSTASLPTTTSPARTSPALQALPAPAKQIRVAVYDFPDLTGAHKPNQLYAEYSRAVTQGASAVLVDALRRAGRGSWFRVVERGGLNNLLKERELIQTTSAALKGGASAEVAPLSFAEYILEGGIVSYDSELEAGGVGASYLGVKGDVSYSKDRVTVALRMTEVRTGDVVLSVSSSSTLYSTSVSAGLTRFISVDDLLTVSAGVTRSDATHVAVQEAIEAAVLQMVEDGLDTGLWSVGEEAGMTMRRQTAAASATAALAQDLPAIPPAAAPPAREPTPLDIQAPLYTGSIGAPVPLKSLAHGTVVGKAPEIGAPRPNSPDNDYWVKQLDPRSR
jgi:curli production assembly/transport component CsgG